MMRFPIITLQKTLLLISLLLYSFGVLAQSLTDNITHTEERINKWVEDKDYASALSYCNSKITNNNRSTYNRYLHVTKMRLFVKSRTSLDSIPIVYNHIQQYKVRNDSLNQFLTARGTEIFGHFYYLKSDIETALSTLYLADSLYALCNGKENRIYNLNMIGNIYKKTNNLSEALIVLLRADQIYTDLKANNPTLINDLHNDLGLVYFNLDEYDKALTYFLNLDYQNLTPLQEAHAHNNIGIIYQSQSKTDSAIHHLKIAELMYISLKRYSDLSGVYNNLGSAYEIFFPSNDSSKYYYTLSIDLKKEQEDSIGVISPTLNLANFYFQTGRITPSKNQINALSPYTRYFSHFDFERYYQILYLHALREKNYHKALDFYKLYDTYADSVAQRANDMMLEKAESTIALENKQRSLELLQNKQELTEIQYSKNYLIFWFLMILFIAAMIILALIANYYRKKQKLEAVLNKRDIRLASYKGLLQGQEEERERLAKELHDSVGNNLSLIKGELLRNHHFEKNKVLLSLINQTTEEVRNITHDLMPTVIKKFGLERALKDLMQNWQRSTELLIDYNSNISHLVIDERNALAIYRIIQEVIKNAVQHGQADYIYIEMAYLQPNLNLIIEDNGKGMEIESSFQKGGLGLQNIQHRINVLKGRMKINSDVSGTKFSFVFPITIT